jgi:predicted CoA-binding protein
MPSPLLLESLDDVAAAVRAARVVAVLGMKDGSDPSAPAYRIPQVLREHGMRVIPVNPKFAAIDGATCYPDLASVPEPFDTVDIFRHARFLPGHAEQILALPETRRPRLVWFQLGIRNDEAAARLVAAGIRVVQDRCLGVDVARFLAKA